MFEKIRELVKDNDRILLAISGGPDSMALLESIRKLRDEKDFSFAVAHVNYHLREDSDQEESYLKEYANSYSIPIYVFSVPKSGEKISEERAREIRYDFFKDIADRYNYNKLMTAHHLDDQTETVLMRLSRGTGPKGAVGIKTESFYKGLSVLRPFLSENKVDLRKYCDDNKIKYFIDSTNLENDFTRNKFRNEIIPSIENFSPNFSENLNTFTQLLDQQNSVIDDIVNHVVESGVKIRSYGIEFDSDLFRDPSNFFQRIGLRFINVNGIDFILSEVIRKVIGSLGKLKDISKEHILEILNFLRSDKNGELQLPKGLIILKSGNSFIATTTQRLPQPFGSYPIDLDLSEIKEKISFKVGEDRLEIEEIDQSDLDNKALKEERAVIVNETILGQKLEFRKRQSDDEVFLSGMSGSKKLSRYMIDKKIPKFLRDSLPVLTNKNTVLWIPGYYLHRNLVSNKKDQRKIMIRYCREE